MHTPFKLLCTLPVPTTANQHFLKQVFHTLADTYIPRREQGLRVARVSGALTSFGDFAENLELFESGERYFEAKGYIVCKLSYWEEKIHKRGISGKDAMEHLHEPLLRSGIITDLGSLPNWHKSRGAQTEHKIASEPDVPVTITYLEYQQLRTQVA
ncbi:MAG: DUF4406 domain-containing protein [Candidatus Pacebacteria bacterium]|nr:DUF4406 domain-containing protein [Candidatus Paceibacterota bacterium]